MLIRQIRPVDTATGHAPARPVDLRLHDGVIAEIAPSLSPTAGEEQLDGGGAIAIPGLWDQHVHTGQLSQAHARLNTSGAESVGVILELVRAELDARRDDRTDPRRALIGFGHRLVDFAVQPTVPALDEVTGAVPTVLIGGDAHHAWMNSAALAALGVPPRDGILAEEDWFALAPRLPELPGVEDSVATGAAMMQRQALDLGVVGLVDMEWGRPWKSWPAQSPRMRIRTAVYPAELAHAPGPTGTVLDPTGLVTMGPLKVIVDGALGSHSAYTREAYSDGHGYAGRGVLSYGADELLDALTRASAQGLTAAVHAIGDAAAQIALGAIAQVDIPARLEHAQMLTDDDVAAMAALGVTASVQPAHLLDDRDATESLWPDRGTQAFRLRDLLSAGVPLALGSDAPVAPLDPWLAMAAAVHRSADDRPGWHPGQQLQPREALAASTDGVRRLEAGGPADLVLLEESPFGDVPLGADGLMVDAAAREAALRLRETRVLTTIVAARASS
ncbi:MAG: amidohydrolase [Brachybacterium alimentarium]